MFEHIYSFFNEIPFDNWALADADRRLPLKIIQLLIARIVYYNGDSVMELYTSFLKSISKGDEDIKKDFNAILIHDFVRKCHKRTIQIKGNNNIGFNNTNNNDMMFQMNDIHQPMYMNNTGLNSNYETVNPTTTQFSRLQKIRELETQAKRIRKQEDINMNFALWLGMAAQKRKTQSSDNK